jgi:hypothetical protein
MNKGSHRNENLRHWNLVKLLLELEHMRRTQPKTAKMIIHSYQSHAEHNMNKL